MVIVAISCATALASEDVDYQLLVDEKLWITEHYPPYHYLQDGAVDGIVIRILNEVFRRNNLIFEPRETFLVFPWARAVKELTTNPNAIVVSMGYTQERNRIFRLTRPVFTETIALIGLRKRNLQLENNGQLSGYFIGAVRDDIGERLLKDLVSAPLNLVYVQSSDELLELLLRGRVDMVVYSERIIDYQITRKSLSHSDFTVLKALQQVPASIAFNREGDKLLFDLINQTIASMQEDGSIEFLAEQYDN